MVKNKHKNKKTKHAKKIQKKVLKRKAKNKKHKSVVLKISARGGSALGGKKISVKQKKKVKVKIKRRKKIKSKKKRVTILSLGNIQPSRGRILALIISIIFMTTGMVFTSVFNIINDQSGKVAGASTEVKIESKLEKGIKKMVKGYPIEKMAPYIAKKDPQTAAFLVAIAKKESNWGKRRPVLNGEDCYNYWGFRLKAERMGSGGHTCFDSPKEAVDAVANRLDELIQEEKINSPNEMVVWKCGYGCQDAEKDKSELKWIKDVGYYYNEVERYL
ncbi:MAG TPA: hypothetical protein P5323_02365 [Candidatus Moranbacteria bacterium]|nr:hypothetical protein [Candidatus Moranbacteria bacterium]HRY27956.1 hypothetical protein [Candidatus Moranbacteria bacterium]HSA08228.1 hypothetical protein [Candidatus Moranbacteria bacterium]